MLYISDRGDGPNMHEETLLHEGSCLHKSKNKITNKKKLKIIIKKTTDQG